MLDELIAAGRTEHAAASQLRQAVPAQKSICGETVRHSGMELTILHRPNREGTVGT